MRNSKVRGLVAGFFSLLFFLVLLTGGTSLVFSSKKVSSWIKSGIESADLKNIEIDFQTAKTTWTGSLRHPFGVRVSDVSIKIKSECRVQKIEFKTLIVPFSIYAALDKKAELGVVKAYEGVLNKYKTCLGTPNPVNDKPVRSTKLETEEKITNFLFSLQNIKPFNASDKFSVRGFLFSDLNVSSKIIKKNQHNFIIDRLKVGIVSDYEYEGQWQGTYKIENITRNIKHVIKLNGDLEIGNKNITFNVSGRKKEGLFNLEIKTPFWGKSDKKPFLKMNFENFPVSSLSDILGLDLKFPEKKKRASWLDCRFTSSFSKVKILLRSSSCRIKGDLGSYNITSGLDLSWLNSEKVWTPEKTIDIRVTNVSLGDIYPVIGRTGPNGIFGDFGKLSIDLSIVSFDSAYAEFELRDFSILFRSKGISSYQKGKSARGTGAIISKDKFDFAIEEMDLEKGEFEGSIRGTFDLSQNELGLDFEIPHLVLNPEISKKLYKTDIGFVSIEGESSFDYKKSLQDIKITFGFDEILAKNWRLGGAKIPCSILNKAVDCSFSLENLTFSKTVQERLETTNRDFRNLRGKLNYFKKKLQITAFRTKEKEPLFKAGWSRDQGLEGELLENGKTSKKLNFRDFK